MTENNLQRQIFSLIKQSVGLLVDAIKKPKVEILGAELITIKGEKGDRGDVGPQGKSIVGPVGPQGEPSHVPGPIGPQGPEGKSIVGPIGPQGPEGKTVVGPQGKQGPVGKDGSPDKPEEIVTKLQSVKRAWLPIDAIAGDFSSRIGPRIVPGGRPLDVSVNGVPQGIAREINFVGNAISAEIIKGVMTITVSDSGGTGFTKETPVGSVDSSNTSFTVTHEPNYVVADGITYFDGAGYTYSALTVTMDSPPSQYIRSYY